MVRVKSPKSAKPRKRPAKPLSAQQKAEIAMERLAGVKEPEVARRHQVARRTVRAAVQAAREAAPEDFEAAGRAIVARVSSAWTGFSIEAWSVWSGPAWPS